MDAKFASLDCRYIGHLRKLPSRIGILNLLVTIFAKHQPYYILISLGPFINSFPISIINVISFTYIWLMLITYSQAYCYHTLLVLAPQGIFSLFSCPLYTYNSIRQSIWINTCHVPSYVHTIQIPLPLIPHKDHTLLWIISIVSRDVVMSTSVHVNWMSMT